MSSATTTPHESAGRHLTAAAQAVLARRRQAWISTAREDLAHLDPAEVIRVVLFGSWARGDFDGGSDIDLLIVTRADTMSPTNLAVINRLPHAQRFDLVIVSEADWRHGLATGNPFHVRVAAEGLVVWAA